MEMGKKTVLEVRVTDVEKRRYPNKHYVSGSTLAAGDSGLLGGGSLAGC